MLFYKFINYLNQHTKMKLFFIIIGTTIISIFFLNFCMYKTFKRVKNYYIVVSNQPMDFDNNEVFAVGGSKWGGRIFIKINGNPIQTIEYGGALIEISQWVRPGNNILSFEGEVTHNFYYKIIDMVNVRNIKKVYAADIIEPGSVKEYKKNFKLNSNYIPEFFLSDLPISEYKDPQLILSSIQYICNALKNQNDKQFLREIYRGARYWSIGLKKQKLIKYKLRSIKENFFSNADLKVIEFNLKDIRIIWGERTALVYSGFCQVMDHKEPYLFKCNIAGKTLYYPQVYFAYVDQKWILWN